MKNKGTDLPRFLTEYWNRTSRSRKDYSLSEPIDKNGLSKKYISLLLPLMEKDSATKVELLGGAGIYPSQDTAKGYYTLIFGLLRDTGILTYNKHTKLWYRGKNWDEYVGWVMTKLCKANVHNMNRMTRMLRSHKENSTNFIMNLAEEQEEKSIDSSREETDSTNKIN